MMHTSLRDALSYVILAVVQGMMSSPANGQAPMYAAAPAMNASWSDAMARPNASGIVAPSVEVLLSRAKKKSHPRSVDVARLQAQNLPPRLLRKLQAWPGDVLPMEPRPKAQGPVPGRGRAAETRSLQQMVFGEEGKALPAAFAWLSTGDPQALNEAKRRVLNLASWDARGPTGFKTHDEAGLSITWTLAIAYDWLYSEFTEAERTRLASVIGDRVGEILGKESYGLDDGKKLDSNPYNSHGAVTLAKVSAVCAVMAGVSPQFDACFRKMVPRYLKRPIPWGGDDGGYANGTNYGQWDVANTHLPVWDVLRETMGVDLTKTLWAKGYGRFITYFLPPGTPTGQFGDGAEKSWPVVWATQAKAYAARVPSPLADWYALQQSGEDPTGLLLPPYGDWSKTPPNIPFGTPNAIHLPSIGWVAMHSDLADRGRTSIYFKSSPYGSFNHSHADQNSFVIHSKGRSLAIDSGYYDSYGSPHWKGWYKQTKAHNAVTFDGGMGQRHDTLAAKGRITAFQHSSDVDIVSGDATAAYGGALTRAVRTLVYLRPDTVLVYDSLTSPQPRTWEWNIHALNKMATDGSTSFVMEEGGERLCGKILEGPAMTFAQTNKFSSDPKGNPPRQWHGTFSTGTRQPGLNMLVMLTVGCSSANAVVTKSGSDLNVTIGKHNVMFSDDGHVELR